MRPPPPITRERGRLTATKHPLVAGFHSSGEPIAIQTRKMFFTEGRNRWNLC